MSWQDPSTDLENVNAAWRIAQQQADDLDTENRHLHAEVERLRDLLREVGQSGVSFDDARLDYVEVQIDRDIWESAVALSRTQNPTED